jgi:hypothetical protein
MDLTTIVQSLDAETQKGKRGRKGKDGSSAKGEMGEGEREVGGVDGFTHIQGEKYSGCPDSARLLVVTNTLLRGRAGRLRKIGDRSDLSWRRSRL